jgi:CRISPR system Cascade subunit CasC
MKLIELHILQSFPVSCLNRDDVGSPKSAVFGGVQRARLSSQSLKRSVRLLARSESPAFQGIRSRFLLEPFTKALLAAGQDETTAATHATLICEAFSKVDTKKPDQVTTAVYLSPGEIKQIATAVAAGEEPKKAIKKVDRLDAADIALFGRMVANDATLNVEGAAMFSHALSTHAAANEIDFFSAVDDLKGDAEDAGAGMIGTLEFNSATYYRYTAINLDQFADANNLGKLTPEQRRAILKDFIRAALTAVPGARKNSMNAATLPFEVLGIRKDKGQPLQLANAFESPVKAKGKGLQIASLAAMKEHLEALEKTWGSLGEKLWLTEIGLDSFLDQLLSGDV